MTESLQRRVTDRNRWISLIRELGSLDLLPEVHDRAAFQERRSEAIRLLRLKIVKEFHAGRIDPLLVVVTGGTNVGKSTVFNGLLGEDVSHPSPFARGTKIPLVVGRPADLELVQAERFLAGYSRSPLKDRAELNREDEAGRGPSQETFRYRFDSKNLPEGLVLVDSTDVDSDRELNLRIASDLVVAADVAVFVVSPTKYRDEICIRSMRRLAALGTRLLVVWNPDEPEHEEALEDFRRSVLQGDLADLLEREPEFFRLAPVPGGTARAVSVELEPLTRELTHLAERIPPVRQTKLRKVLAEVRSILGSCFARMREEGSILGSVRDVLRRSRDRALEAYREAIGTISRRHVDSAFHVYWLKTQVPWIDPTMAHAYKLLRKAMWLLGFTLDNGPTPHVDVLAPLDRTALRTLVQKLIDGLDRELQTGGDARYREIIDEFRRSALSQDMDEALSALMAVGTRSRRDWLDSAIANLLAQLKERRGKFQLVTTLRALFTLGPAIALCFWIGSWPAIILVIPTVHGLMSQLLKKLASKLYFARQRGNLEDQWVRAVGAELENVYLHGVGAKIPEGPSEAGIKKTERSAKDALDEFEAWLDTLPTVERRRTP